MKLEPQTQQTLKTIKALLESALIWGVLCVSVYLGLKWLTHYEKFMAYALELGIGIAVISIFMPRAKPQQAGKPKYAPQKGGDYSRE